VRVYPALTIGLADAAPSRAELLLAILDDFQVTAIEDTPDSLRVFFTREAERDAAAARLRAEADLTVTAEDVPDDDWAARSQAGIRPIEVLDLTIAPPWAADKARATSAGRTLVIQPSMGFGTGHHASTRLCLRLLQQLPLAGLSVLDIGTGSGVLAIAAATLGANRVTGVDLDPDALENARENLELNDLAGRVELVERDLSTEAAGLEPCDIVLANLTGGLLCRDAATIAVLVASGGSLIASGFQAHELDEVTAAFESAGLRRTAQIEEASWIGAEFKKTSARP
jgi:ribosomal protein L11 methyltransferase